MNTFMITPTHYMLLSAALFIIGDRLGLYRAMRDGRPVSAEQLAKRTETPFKLVLEARP